MVDAATALASSKPAAKRQKKAKAAVPEESLERRISSRERKAVNYCEMEARTAREPKAPVDHSERIKVRHSCCTTPPKHSSSAHGDPAGLLLTHYVQAMTLDKDTAEQLRKEMESKKGSSKSGGKARGPVDSGKGVRIQVRLMAAGQQLLSRSHQWRFCAGPDARVCRCCWLQGGRVYDSAHGVTCHW